MINSLVTKLKSLQTAKRHFFVVYGAAVFILGLFLVWLDFDAKVDIQISKASSHVQLELDEFYQKLENLVQSRNFLTNVIFNVNLAATAEIDQFVDQFPYTANVFVYDSDRRYFGKNKSNKLNRFEYKLSGTDESIALEQSWKFFEKNSKRYIERYSILQTDGSKVGYVRVILSLDELQQHLLSSLQTGAHLTVKNMDYQFVRCALNKNTDLYFCMPLNLTHLLKHSGTMLAFVVLLWAFLVFVVRFYMRGRLAAARAETLVEISSQVSHDIQSPLLALKMATKAISNLPDDKRLMLQRSIERIEDIANDLRNKRDSNLGHSGKHDLQLLYGLVTNILSEKRLQFKYRNIELDLFIGDQVPTAFVNLPGQDFKRVLSNIINNAVEAIPGHGNVGIELEKQGSELIVRVIDNGIGIRKELIEQAKQKGRSFGKEDGQGLGLYHADKTVAAWGASLDILSTEGAGTTVEIRIPEATAPDWFPVQRTLHENTKIVILDDDQNIHELWTSTLRASGIGNELIHFYHIESAQKSLESMDTSNLLFLVDYELIHSGMSGIDFINKNKLSQRSVLVTARFDEEKILAQCKANGIKLLPKILMTEYDLLLSSKEPSYGSIDKHLKEGGLELVQTKLDLSTPPRQSAESTKSKKILIDDDALVRATWTLAAGRTSTELECFASAGDFLEKAEDLPLNSEIYIDVDMGKIRGDQWSKTLFDMGFRNLFITTGFDDFDRKEFPWIKKAISKEPPF